MNIHFNNVSNNYLKADKNSQFTKKNQEVKNETKQSKFDTLELSNKDNPPKFEYDIKKVMEIHEKGFHTIPTKEESDYYNAARKSDKALDTFLYEKDKAEAMEFVGKIQALLLKAVSGVKLTKEEQEMIKNDLALQQEISMRKSKAELFKL